jgi:kumamolisin
MKPLPGSNKQAARNARFVGDVDPEHVMSVTAVLRPKQGFDLVAHAARGSSPMGQEEFAAQYGADPEDVLRLEEYAGEHHLVVGEVNVGARTVELRGRTADMQKAFSVDLKLYATEDNKRFRGREGDVFVPDDLDGIVIAVLGLDDRPVAKPHSRRLDASLAEPDLEVKSKAAPAATPRPFDAPAVGKLYGFPASLNGSGQTIAIIELGGGYRTSDLNTYFNGLGLKTPKVSAVGVGGSTNNPGVDNGADGEVALDIEVAGAIAPKAKIAVYFAPNTTAGFLNAINKAVHDTLRKPSVVSISWGGAEVNWTAASLQQYDAAFQAAGALGVTVLTASGDDGASDGVNDGKAHVDFPSSSPHVLACGGTRLVASNATTIANETVWNDGPHGPGAGGGGVSNSFAKPSYQSSVTIPPSPTGNVGRGVPDVSGNADPFTGYNVVVDGVKSVIGGTSAVAPLYAGLTALVNQARASAGRVGIGFIHPALYATAGACRDVTQTNNDYSGTLGVYAAGPGWDACSGLGSAIGTHWLTTFVAAPAAAASPTLQPAQPQV